MGGGGNKELLRRGEGNQADVETSTQRSKGDHLAARSRKRKAPTELDSDGKGGENREKGKEK